MNYFSSRQTWPNACATNPLTKRQLECLEWVSEGKSSTNIGEILGISRRTVDYHMSEICERLNVRAANAHGRGRRSITWIAV